MLLILYPQDPVVLALPPIGIPQLSASFLPDYNSRRVLIAKSVLVSLHLLTPLHRTTYMGLPRTQLRYNPLQGFLLTLSSQFTTQVVLMTTLV